MAKKTKGQEQLESVGYTVHRHWRGKWFDATDPTGEECAVLKMGNGCWHWFSKAHQSTASGSSVESAHRGNLGDAIDSDSTMRAYKQCLSDSNVPKPLQEYAGVFAAMSQVYNG